MAPYFALFGECGSHLLRIDAGIDDGLFRARGAFRDATVAPTPGQQRQVQKTEICWGLRRGSDEADGSRRAWARGIVGLDGANHVTHQPSLAQRLDQRLALHRG